MKADRTVREAHTGIPVASRSLLKTRPIDGIPPSYTFFFTLEDMGPYWPSLENPEVRLSAPTTATLKRSTVAFDAWALQDRGAFPITIQNLSTFSAPWSLVWIEDTAPTLRLSAQLCGSNGAFQYIDCNLDATALPLAPIRYIHDTVFVPTFEVENLIAVLLWPNFQLVRSQLEQIRNDKHGRLFRHIWQPPIDEHKSGSFIARAMADRCT